jgi:hypothetical protein
MIYTLCTNKYLFYKDCFSDCLDCPYAISLTKYEYNRLLFIKISNNSYSNYNVVATSHTYYT